MSRWIAIAVAVLLCMGLALRELACSSSTPAGPRPSATHEPFAHDLPPREPGRIAQPEAAPATAPATAPPPNAPGGERARAEVPLMPPTGHFQAMLRAFAAESRDSRWASEQEARVVRLLAESGFADDAYDRREVICRRATCRFDLRVVEGSEADMLALMKLAAAVQTRDGLSLAYGAAEVDGEKVRITVLTPSEGTSLGDAGAR